MLKLQTKKMIDPKALFQKDARYKSIFAAMTKHRKRADSLIEVLHVVQDVFGFIPLEAMRYVAFEMKIPPSRIYGISTFYHFFSLKPKGEHLCVVCTGTACHVKGAAGLLNQIERILKLKPGETTPDGKFGLQTARCLGGCGLAPVAVIDGDIIAKANPDDIVNKIRSHVKVSV